MKLINRGTSGRWGYRRARQEFYRHRLQGSRFLRPSCRYRHTIYTPVCRFNFLLINFSCIIFQERLQKYSRPLCRNYTFREAIIRKHQDKCVPYEDVGCTGNRSVLIHISVVASGCRKIYDVMLLLNKFNKDITEIHRIYYRVCF